MTTSTKSFHFGHVKILAEPVGTRQYKKSIRRPILLNKNTGTIHEFPTIYIYREHGQKSLNTQRSILFDIAFYLEWVGLKQLRQKHWNAPETRVRQGQLAISAREVAELCRWCQLSASEIAHAVERQIAGLASIPLNSVVDPSTADSRIRNICNYLLWITQEFIQAHSDGVEINWAKNQSYKESISKNFSSQLNTQQKASPIKSLRTIESNLVRSLLKNQSVFPNSDQGTRDRLIVELFLDSGLRSGELLKLYCEDLDTNYELAPDKHIAILNVKLRPNDIHDERMHEPASKTFPGPIQINKNLANRLLNYILKERRSAINKRVDESEQPYIFVSHVGVQTGKPIGYRNLNRIISKLKKVAGLPNWIAPHVLRHTHFNEFADLAEENGGSEAEIRAMLTKRGHWRPESNMPEHYTQRRIARKTSEIIEIRDELIEPTKKN
ncbi:MAG: site-specific integrase [Undibacterium umbellatum]|uniref:tyrosine-type recombinase/integrase n=1 Tax=Undibacterium umbellatum TaxID=2762300 RepID=UPI003BB609B5